MVVSQQIAPSALRAYKLSKYANGQPGKMLLEAKRVKRVTSQFMSKSGAKEAAKRMKALKKTASSAKKVADAVKKVNEILLKKVPGSNDLSKANRISAIIGVLAAIGIVALLKFQEFVTGRGFDDLSQTQLDLTKVNTTAVNNGLKLKTLETKLQKYEQELSANARDYHKLNKQQEFFGKSILETKKQANDALFETREGRKIVEGKVAEAKKQSNDALFEARANRQKLEGEITGIRNSFDAKIQQINTQISKFNSNVSDTFQKSVNATISKIQSDLAAIKAQVTAIPPIRPQTPVNAAEINAAAVAAAKAEVNGLKGIIAGLTAQVGAAMALGSTAISGISNLAQGVSSANTTANQALNEARAKPAANIGSLQQQLDEKFAATVAQNAKDLKIRDLQLSDLSKEFDERNKNFFRQSTLSADQRYKEFIDENNKALKVRDLQLSDLSKDFDKRNAEFFAQSTKTSQEIYDGFIEQNKQALGTIKSEVTIVKSDIKTNAIDIAKVDTKLKDQEKVNALALPKLDQILGILPLIPARAAAAIRPDIPTIPQIETAAATGTCRTTQPGGCMNRALNDNAANITSNNNNNAANILDAVNTGANAALLTGQQTILARLGDQLPGGIGGKLSRFADWMHLDRVLNILIFATTIHNGAMLSNNIAQTLLGALNNVLSAIGLKKEDGSTFDLASIINGTIENLVKQAIGANNYAELSANWANAVRVYQATANVFNSITNLANTVISSLEVIGGQQGKIGNALRIWGVVSEKAYSWMNPQPNYENRFFKFLEKTQATASTVSMVAQVPIDIGSAISEVNSQREEFSKSLKQDDSVKPGTPSLEAIKVKEVQDTAKAASASTEISQEDKAEGTAE